MTRRHIPLSLVFLIFTTAQAAKVQDKAPAFLLTNSLHKERSLADYRGKIVFINFWASWCAPCQVELPLLNRLAADFKGQAQVIVINVDQNRAEAQALLNQLKLMKPKFQILWDPRGKAASAYDIDGMPASFVVDGQGVIRYEHLGFRSDDPGHWRQEIKSLRPKI